MHSRSHRWNLILFLSVIAVLTVLNLIQPGGTQEVSQLEQRKLQEWPAFSAAALAKGTLLKDIDNYFADHFVFRDRFVELGFALKEMKGMRDNDGVSIVVRRGGNNMGAQLGQGVPGGPAGGDEAGAGAPAGPENAPNTEAAEEAEGEVVDSTYLVYKDMAMLLYIYTPNATEAYANAVNRYRSLIDPNIRVYSMLVPSLVEFVDSEKLRKLSGSQKEAFDHAYSLYDPQITSIPVLENLQAHIDEYVFFRSDHHWTALGAYYGYEAAAKAMGIEPLPLEAFEQKELADAFLGSAYAATLSEAVRKNPDTIVTYHPKVKYSYQISWNGINFSKRDLIESKIPEDGRGGYAVFLGGDFALSRIQTDVKNGRKLLVIKDSYANAMVPYLMPHFQEIVILDPRFYKGDLIKETAKNGITDVLFVNGAIVTSYTGIADMLQALMPAKP